MKPSPVHWEARTPWTTVPHGHAGGHYALTAIDVSGLSPKLKATVLIGVGPVGDEQEALRMDVRGPGLLILPHAVVYRDGVRLSMKASRLGVRVAVRSHAVHGRERR